MPLQTSYREYAQAVLDSVRSGAFPESEEVISAELPPSAVPTVLKLIDEAHNDVKTNIRQISKESASDVDGWITQAKQLRHDIDEVEKSARKIVRDAEQGGKLQSHVTDAASKVSLLKGELVFNETLVITLETIAHLQKTLELIETAMQSDSFLDAVVLLEKAEEELVSLGVGSDTKVVGLLQAHTKDLRYTLVKSLSKCWRALLHVDSALSVVSIRNQILRPNVIPANDIIRALLTLGLLEDSIMSFCHDFEKLILIPRLQRPQKETVHAVYVEDNAIRINEGLTDLSMEKLIADMCLIVGFLHNNLPRPIMTPLAALLMPGMIQRLISNWLMFEVPIDVEGIISFQEVLNLLIQFARTLDSHDWPGEEILVNWIKGIPDVWLGKRREVSLNKIRRLLIGGLGSIETVERMETQILSHQEDRLGESYCKEIRPEPEKLDVGETVGDTHSPRGVEEDDVSAWGLDEDADEDSTKDKLQGNPALPDAVDTVDAVADAWGWGDDKDDGAPSNPVGATSADSQATIPTNEPSEENERDSRQITLKEMYNISSLPKQILQIITELISDAQKLRTPKYIESPIASAAGGLFYLPGLVLSMYRASAPNYYLMNPSGRMLLYNDSLWLAESLRNFTGTESSRSGQINVGAAETEISALELFAKRTYGREMESQRTIIGDLLDGAQGFANCTEPLFSQECDTAINSVVDRLRDIYRQWKLVLSHAALLQSIGSLLSTVLNKIIVDVEDMSDISEPESQRLTDFCNRIAALEDLFTPPQTSHSEATARGEVLIPLTAVYTPNWLKFQYLTNILESSLVDIKYLWTEGELRLEFETEELVDLIEALFADSDHRRKAIGEIRRRSVRR